MYTKYGTNEASLEMGATWLGAKHTALLGLLEELELPIFEQVLGNQAIYEPLSTSPPQLVSLPPNTDPSFRIKGGSSHLIHVLAKHLESDQIILNQQVHSISQENQTLIVQTNDLAIKAKSVISTLPPALFAAHVSVKPSLPVPLTDIAQQTHTWMGESIKVALSYAQPFWREKGSSGTIFSNVGPIPEMYDHSTAKDTEFALKGFFNGSYFSLSKEERLGLVMKQLSKYYGELAADFLRYEEMVWRNEPLTFTPYASHVLPHQNNGHAIFQQSYLDGKLFLAGSETAQAFPGYMDGAVRSAQWVAEQV